ncbi:DNA-binding protein [Halobellus marinus]|jgi:DNA-binding PadR family transcriptional regulator|uniref:DNA-binding protein n=1 Tax=Halobellus TaxID=1073986 RepID=UPI0028B1DA51|nr:DNA-binding protein [Halobellus sp. DFY28]
MRWLQSGRRRDLCALLYEAGSLRRQQLKTALERHYETRIEPQSFAGSVDALVDRGLVARDTEGIHDVYHLTDEGVAAVEAYHQWLAERLHGGADGGSETGGDDSTRR